MSMNELEGDNRAKRKSACPALGADQCVVWHVGFQRAYRNEEGTARAGKTRVVRPQERRRGISGHRRRKKKKEIKSRDWVLCPGNPHLHLAFLIGTVGQFLR